MKAAYRGPFPTVESRLPTWVLAHQLWTEAGEAFLTDQEHDLERLRALPSVEGLKNGQHIFGGHHHKKSCRLAGPQAAISRSWLLE